MTSDAEHGLYVDHLQELSDTDWEKELLDTISRFERYSDEIKSSLNDPKSKFKIINPRFRLIDKGRWLECVESTGSRQINLRLVYIVEDHPLTLDFAERKSQACLYATWSLLGLFTLRLSLITKAKRLRKENAEQGRIDRINLRIQRTSEMFKRTKRSRNFNRFLLYAARYHILDPRRQPVSREAKKADTVRSAQAKNTTVNVTENNQNVSIALESPERQGDPPGTHPLVSPKTNKALRSRECKSPLDNDFEAGSLPQEPSSNYPIDLDFANTFSMGAVMAGFDPDIVTLPTYSSIWPQDPSYPQAPPDYGSTLPASGQVVPSIVDPYFQSSVDPRTFSYSTLRLRRRCSRIYTKSNQ